MTAVTISPFQAGPGATGANNRLLGHNHAIPHAWMSGARTRAASNRGLAEMTTSACYRCESELDPDRPDLCPACGRRQTRACFCGETISRGVDECPHCGADWAKVRRSRQKRQSSKKRKRHLAVYMAAGGAAALLVGLLGWSAHRAVASGADQAIADWAGDAARQIATASRHVGPALAGGLLIIALGAACGTIVYYWRKGARRRHRLRRGPSS